LSFAAALIVSTPSARADTWNKKTIVSFSQAIEVPGTVLQPGKYVMKLVDLPADRHIVQFTNERENHIYATAMAIPTYRDRVTDSTVIAFYEAPAGQPEAIKNWYYPGDNYGQEFLYPKGRGTRLAAFTPTDTSLNSRNDTNVSPVLTPEPVSSPPLETAAVTPPAPTPQPVEIAQATPPTQGSEPVPIAQNPQAPSVTAAPPTTQDAPADTTLPKTAGNLAEIGALGLLSFVGAVAVRKFRNSVS
jgi:hypothetical protein